MFSWQYTQNELLRNTRKLEKKNNETDCTFTLDSLPIDHDGQSKMRFTQSL